MQLDSQAQLIKALDLLLDVICVVDADGKFVAISAACERVFGYTQAELIGKPMLELVLPEDRARTIEAATGVMSGNSLQYFENRYVRKDGQVIDIMWSARWSESEQLRLAVAREVTVRKQAESMQAVLYGISEAAHSAGDLAGLLQRIHQIIGDRLPNGSFMVALHDPGSGAMTFPYFAGEEAAAVAACRTQAALLAAEVIATGATLLLTPHAMDRWPTSMLAAAGRDAVDRLGVPLVASQRTIGALVVQSDSAAHYSEQHKTLLQFVSTQIAANIERKQASARLQYLAQYDVLTDLPNRALFEDRLQVALVRAARDQKGLALLYIDLDDFKMVNDSFGHAIGDLLLQQVATRIRGCVRESDTVSRIGGDEFVVLIDTLQTPQNASSVAENIRAALHRPFALAAHDLTISSSIGIASYPEHGTDHKQLARNADVAMYVAKNQGGNQCRIFSG